MHCDDCGSWIEDGDEMWEVGDDHLVCGECQVAHGDDALLDAEGDDE